MKYFNIYLRNGKVLDICSFDEIEARDRQYNTDSDKLSQFGFLRVFCANNVADEIQKLDQVD